MAVKSSTFLQNKYVAIRDFKESDLLSGKPQEENISFFRTNLSFINLQKVITLSGNLPDKDPVNNYSSHSISYTGCFHQ